MADFFSNPKFSVASEGQIPDLNLGGSKALNSQTAVTTANNALKPTTGGIESYRYPKQMIGESSDYIQFKVVSFKQPVFETTSDAPFLTAQSQEKAQEQARKSGTEEIKGFVTLPMPQGIADANSVEWGSSSLNPLEAAGLSATTKLLQKGTPMDVINEVMKGGASMALNSEVIKNAQTAIAAGAVNFAGGNINIRSIISRATGQVLNPNQELLLEGPTLRSFSFAFDLVPRYAAEGEEILQMIRFLKKSMAIKRGSGNGFFLSAPDLFQIKYMSGKENHPFLNRFKICALTNMTVNYTGSNTYATYEDGTPVHIQLGLNFNEINPIYAQDYDDAGLGGVGY